MHFLERIAEERIREAMERGDFDDLPLSGKPLPLESNGFVPEDLRLAYKLLKNAGFLPREMELRKEIVSLKELLATVDDGEKRAKLACRINDLVLRLNLMGKRSFDRADQEVYVRKLSEKLSRR
ncbi:MAG TPA: DnaJ family domain-containing protein [Vicinamibacteria bacterium]|jgi:hypothetical protein